jgi:hypothetical protein
MGFPKFIFGLKEPIPIKIVLAGCSRKTCFAPIEELQRDNDYVHFQKCPRFWLFFMNLSRIMKTLRPFFS